MKIVGFDIGNDTSAVAVVKTKSVDVLLNDESKYETPSVVSFAERKRHFGFQALSLTMRNPAVAISQIKRIIGKGYEWPGIAEQLSELPFLTRRGEDGGILIRVHHAGEAKEFTPVQILAMLLSNLRKMVEANVGGIPVSRLVIGVPSHFTDWERNAYLDAVEISGVDRSNARLMHEGTAIALGYGFYKTEMENGRVVVFVDVGHCHTQVTVVRFSQRKMQVLCHESNRNLGGRDFDRVLFGYFSNLLRDKYGVGTVNYDRMRARLMAECEKVKKVLTSNKEARINIECFLDDLDFSEHITRKEFERVSLHLVQNITTTCWNALIHIGMLDLAEVHSVELAGSGSRIPAISDNLSKCFKKNVSRTLNSSECIARGCALQASIIAANSSVKDYKVEDCVPSTIGFCSSPSAILLFLKCSPFPSVIRQSFANHNGFFFDMFHSVDLHWSVQRRFSIGPVKATKAHQIPIVQVDISLNADGIIDVYSSNPTVTDFSCCRMSRDNLMRAKDTENNLASLDKEILATQQKRNALEAYVYDTRKKLCGRYQSFACDLEKEKFSRVSDDIEKWLYADGDGKTQYVLHVYTAKLDELKEFFAPIENRFKNNELIIKATKDFEESIHSMGKSVVSWPVTKRKLFDIESEKANQWLLELKQFHESLPKNIDQVLRIISFIKQKTTTLNESRKCVEKGGTSLQKQNRFSYQTEMMEKQKPKYAIDSFITGLIDKISGSQITFRDLFIIPKEIQSQQKQKDLEANLTEVHGKILERYEHFIGESEKEDIANRLKQIMKHCHQKGNKSKMYDDRITNDLKMLLHRHEHQYNDEQDGVVIIYDLLYCIFEQRVEAISLPNPSKEIVRSLCCDIDLWLKDRMIDMASKCIIPVSTSREMKHKMDELNGICNDILEQVVLEKSQKNHEQQSFGCNTAKQIQGKNDTKVNNVLNKSLSSSTSSTSVVDQAFGFMDVD